MRSLSFTGVVLLIGVITCATLGIAVAEQEQMCVPMGIIELKPPATVEAKRASVLFDHNRHFVIACNECHHTWDGTQTITGCMTSGCHDLDTLPRKEDSNKVDKALAYRYYKSAYHGQCIGCHRSMKLENEKAAKTLASMDSPAPATGPLGCIECHPKD
jgi:hypothetical protein